MTALDAPTQPRVARSGPRRGRVPPRRAPVPTAVLRPPPPAPPAISPPRRRRRAAVLAVTTGALAAGLLTGAALALLGLQVTPAPTGPDPATALRAVQRLGTVGPGPQSLSVTFTMDAGSGLPGFSNTFTYRAVGTDAASVDLTQLGPADVRLHGHAASVRIPSAHLDPPVVDDSSSGVVRHDEGLFTGLLENGDVNPSDLRSAASSHLSDQAQQRGLPEAAQRLAGDQVRAALRPLGITSVAVSYAA